MEPSFQWSAIGANQENTGMGSWFTEDISPKIIEIMGALIQEPIKFRKELRNLLYQNTTLCIGGELKEYGEGLPAANFRYKKDITLNENVVQNYFHLFKTYNEMTGKPIIITTIPRSWRKYSFMIQENGTIIRKDEDHRRDISNPEGRLAYTGFPGGDDTGWDEEATNLTIMLKNQGITQENMKKIRQSCEGAKFHTYLIDMISFLYQMKINTHAFHSIFTPEYRRFSSVRGGEPLGSWTPDPETLYLYMNKTTGKDGIVFFVPIKSSVKTIYADFNNAISPEENEMKKKIREHCCKYQIDRWTDFDANDTDDAFTILMILHAFNCPKTLEIEEQLIKTKLELLMEPWFTQL